MVITESKAKMKIGDKYYTLMQKDEESQFKFHFDGGYINLVTKDEVIVNSPDVIYKDNVKGFYKANGTLVQLAFKENFDFPQHYELLFNSQEGFIRTSNIKSDEYFTTAKILNVSRSFNIIEYNKFNSDIIPNDINTFKTTEDLTLLAEKITTPNQKILDLRTETEVTYNNLDTIDTVKGYHLQSLKTSPARKSLDLRLEETCENITLTNTTRDDFRGGIMLGSEVEVND